MIYQGLYRLLKARSTDGFHAKWHEVWIEIYALHNNLCMLPGPNRAIKDVANGSGRIL